MVTSPKQWKLIQEPHHIYIRNPLDGIGMDRNFGLQLERVLKKRKKKKKKNFYKGETIVENSPCY